MSAVLRDEAMARRAILRLMSQYDAAVDAGLDEGIAGLFGQSGVLRRDGRQWRGEVGIRAGLQHWRSRPLAAGSTRGRARLRRDVVSSVVVFVGPGEARGVSHFVAVGPSGVDHSGRYLDVFVRTSAGWRFGSRDVLLDHWSKSMPAPRSPRGGRRGSSRPRAAGTPAALR